ncbi:hypothetical protein C2E21_0773 isoform B [Chlorella sorokiniana]|uniref:Uncharacterized protein n=1 Tax=Chlorella sorokiniana TaxID=3076 RepID=A0A2P6U3B2_CHLSO|nr:hypothetical protein C2E21_0773 isoform C [Chlorella sorokiniana]PRW60790.1 hypothetical protein C2E21_0773 isoform A [Chlorella sorokiniana]PRW60791.1 hypothetical protein C2E21_0773 isoform B [Chlorella sorokiniana]|eukprot:PRW60789.1 hypothetical protein C2E21_0773 isoform C [Chlorella sorokiniana]
MADTRVPPAELRATLVPVSTKLVVGEKPALLLLIHDQRRGDPSQQNQQAIMLTISLATGLGMEVYRPPWCCLLSLGAT